MKNLWNDQEAERLVGEYAAKGVARDLALRVYTTRLLGGEPRLVLHGGGNTSVKATATDLVGDTYDVLHVKGSGWDMAVIEPAGLPAVKMAPLLKARAKDVLSDEDMVALQRANLIDPSSPNPSVETLLHAFLPHKFVDHTHSTAVLAIVDQGTDSVETIAKVFGPKMGYVPYIKPGFDLAKAAAEVFEKDTSVEGLILDKHGIFTFAETAKEAYDLMIHWVTVAEDYVAKNGKAPAKTAALPATLATAADIASSLRGAVAVDLGEGRFDRMVSDFRTSPAILDFLANADLQRLADRGVSTPDLSIRIKTGPMVLPAPAAGDANYPKAIREKVAAYVAEYTDYFRTNDARDEVRRTMLDPMPRLSLVPGVGIFGHGRTLKDAKIASDVAEAWMDAVRGAEAIGDFRPLAKSDLFELEYWSLEQAKLAGNKPKPLTGQVMLVTGGAGAIGAATAKMFAANGAHVVVVDLDEAKAKEVAKAAGNASIGVGADVTKPADVRAAFDKAVATYGGVDIVVSNAGAAFEGAIGEIDDALLRKSFELNFFAHQSVAQNAVRIFKQQGTGGCLLFNTSKQAINPGPKFGAYGLPKAATLFLSRQYALDYGSIGVRSNAVNADRIRSGLLTDAMIASRSTARGLSEKDYMSGNLLGQEVTADHVAQAFLHHALAERTTADVTTVDGGNIAATLR
ncbi:bifunctional aldolase/short-chain dehydrogenase [Mesorhizobium australicum]|uniref:Rhamnose utilisation protein RhaD, predicted bifunctional aldolase and dehydrogenase n=1 Tax=Mesorhizobium australicum TaxID=536018 RepID=A0A1X7PUY9_9HYPH|nr:bifunctional aldolase/short-chain dehydrogenase [Mesorhizobium australicum]SMH56079.1 Rhamnose utilisation protein RhaD, predicted bifunctional aldolase and dehydrogenase [Mesorhizobium australicum]